MNIRGLIRREATRHPGSSPAQISAAILAQLPDADLRAALQTALPYLARDEVRKVRHHALGVPDRSTYARPDPPPPPADLTGPRRRAAARKASDAAQAKLARTKAFLATGVSVNGTWKTLGDCTPTDLRALARESKRRAAENAARAEGYERLAKDMEREGIALVRDYEEVGLVRQVFAAA